MFRSSCILIVASLLTACAILPGSHPDDVAFSEQGVHSPVFDSADDCVHWLDQQSRIFPRQGEALDGQLVLTSWNIQKNSEQRWEEQIHQLVEQSDILLLQEAVIIPAREEVIPHPYVAVAEAHSSWIGPTGLISASHVEPMASCTFINREPLLRSRKASNVLLFPLADQSEESLLVVNIHSINFSMGLGAYTNQIQELAEVMKQHEGPIIFGGDLNTWNLRRIDLVNSIAQALSLSEVAFSTDNRAHFLGRPLDRIYYRGIRLTDARTKAASSSDHNPLIAIWDLEPGA